MLALAAPAYAQSITDTSTSSAATSAAVTAEPAQRKMIKSYITEPGRKPRSVRKQIVPAARLPADVGFEAVPSGWGPESQPEFPVGTFLFHGNYCGVGNRPGTRPIDALDAACMHHDACVGFDELPSCACHARLQGEATAVAQDPREPPDIQFLASITAAGSPLLLCDPTPRRFRHPHARQGRTRH